MLVAGFRVISTLRDWEALIAVKTSSISQQIASEVVAGNQDGIQKILRSLVNSQETLTASWSPAGPRGDGVTFIYPNSLVYRRNVLGEDGRDLGAIIVERRFDVTNELWSILGGEFFAVLLIFFLSFTTLTPLARTVPQRFVLTPLQSVLRQLQEYKDSGRVNRATSEYSEISNLMEQLTNLMEEHRSLQAKTIEAERNAAVARMTQMLAHDVRKPFSILKIGLGMLGNARDPASVKSVISRLVPEIDKAVSSVDGLISDVMEVGSNSVQLIQEAASPESLIEASIGEIFRIYPKSDVSMTYDLRHVHMAYVHVQKIGRVFANILGNALQAMRYRGQVWFRTEECDGWIQFCIGNTGSVIALEDLPKLFDAFFTSGKKGGTGLGLAIAQKVIAAHGGKIWCESARSAEHPDGKVEFFFTLPVAKSTPCQTSATLPAHSAEVIGAIRMGTIEASTPELDKGVLTLEDELIQAAARRGRPLRVLAVDDEPVYRSALSSYLGRSAEMLAAVALQQAKDSAEALAAVAQGDFDLVITDVDMGTESLDGFALVRELRKRGLESLVCVHSNRIVVADHKAASQAGADAFLPKPMAKAQLLRLLLQAAQECQSGCHFDAADSSTGARAQREKADDKLCSSAEG